VAIRIEIGRLMLSRRDFIAEVGGRRIMVAAPTSFDLLPVSGYANAHEMIEAFDAKLIGKL